MKDRWKLLITSIVIGVVVITLIAFLMSSFKQVSLTEYGILYYSIYRTVENQQARVNGNYLVGLDHSFYTFPRGIISIEFDTLTLSQDKSMVQVEGLFLGRLVKSQILNMYTNYGFQYMSFLKTSVADLARQAIQTYSLSELITKRADVDNYVNGYVCLQLETTYSWIQCDVVSLGRVGSNIPEPVLLSAQTTFQQKQIELLNQKIEVQKSWNIYNGGGLQMLREMQEIHSGLFNNVSLLLGESLSGVGDVEQWSRYILDSASHPVLKNQFEIDL